MTEKKQEFQEKVGQVVQTDTFTQINSGQGRVLTGKERAALNGKIVQLHEKYGEHGGKTWTFLHQTIGVDCVDDIRLEQRDAAHAIVDLLLERAKLQHELKNGPRSDTRSSRELAERIAQVSDLTAKLSHLQHAHDAQVEQRQEIQQAYAELQGANRKQAKQLADAASQLRNAQQAQASLEQQYRQQTARLNETAEQLRRAQETARRSQVCTTCQTNWHKLTNTRKLLLTASIMASTAIGAAIVLGYRGHFASNRAELAEARIHSCEFGAKPYTIGSIIDNPQAPDIQCVADPKGGQPHWQTLKPQKTVVQSGATGRLHMKRAKHSVKESPSDQTPEETIELPAVDAGKLLF